MLEKLERIFSSKVIQVTELPVTQFIRGTYECPNYEQEKYHRDLLKDALKASEELVGVCDTQGNLQVVFTKKAYEKWKEELEQHELIPGREVTEYARMICGGVLRSLRPPKAA